MPEFELTEEAIHAMNSRDESPNLSSMERARNLRELYEKLPKIAQIPDLKSALQALHAKAMRDYSPQAILAVQQLADETKCAIVNTKLFQPGEFRSAETFRLLGNRRISIQSPYFIQIGRESFRVWIELPGEEKLPVLLDCFIQKVESLLNSTEDDEKIHLIVLWASHIFILLHPFYDGNGRVSRAFSSLLLLRKKREPQWLEVKKDKLTERDKQFLNSLGDNFLIRLYLKYISGQLGSYFLPQYLERKLLQVNSPENLSVSELRVDVDDIIGDFIGDRPDDIDLVTRASERRMSLERLLEHHLKNVALDELYDLFTKDELDWFRTKPDALTPTHNNATK